MRRPCYPPIPGNVPSSDHSQRHPPTAPLFFFTQPCIRILPCNLDHVTSYVLPACNVGHFITARQFPAPNVRYLLKQWPRYLLKQWSWLTLRPAWSGIKSSSMACPRCRSEYPVPDLFARVDQSRGSLVSLVGAAVSLPVSEKTSVPASFRKEVSSAGSVATLAKRVD